MPQEEAVEAVEQALARAVTGDMHGGAECLVPLIADSIGTAYALASMLAETASHIARRDQEPGFFFGIVFEDAVTGEQGSTDDMDPEFRFAAQFVTAWANRDFDMAEALFKNLVNACTRDDGTPLIDGLIALFQLAVITATEVVAEQRAARTTIERDSLADRNPGPAHSDRRRPARGVGRRRKHRR